MKHFLPKPYTALAILSLLTTIHATDPASGEPLQARLLS